MKIVLFGGSFDPIHNGHLAIVKAAKSHVGAKKALLIPSKAPRWKNPTPIEDRLNMVKLALKEEPEIELCEIELQSQDEINYTVDTLKKLKKIYPEDELYFLIGTDQLDQFERWKEPETIASLCHLLCYQRPGYVIRKEMVKKYDVDVFGLEGYDISSTEIRKGSKLLAPYPVLNYIVDHELYFMPYLKSLMKKHRYLHSISVARTAYEIASNNGIDPIKAFQAGLFHDMGKDIPEEEQRKICEEHFPQYCPVPSFALHQFAGCYLAGTTIGIHDQEVLSAIMYHCTGRAQMSPLEMCVYAADKVEPTREFQTQPARDMCNHNLKEGFLEVLNEQDEFLKAKGVDARGYSLAIAMYEYYKK